MRRIAYFFIGALLLGLVAGAILSFPSQQVAASGSRDWDPIASPPDYATISDRLSKNLTKSGQFGHQSILLPDVVPDLPIASESPFPAILTVQTVDGVPFVTLQSAARQIDTFAVGDTVYGDWQIVSIDLEKIVAQREGSISEIIVFPSAQK